MNKLAKYSREELERKLLHITAFAAHKLATEYIELTDPIAKIIRTAEAEQEHTNKILELIVLIFPAWDIVEHTHDSYDVMREWITKNHEQALLKSCICDGCKPENSVN